jgi:hypothetical protein
MIDKRWIYVGMLLVSVVGFAVDRLFLGSPKPAEAKEVVKPAAPKPARTATPPKAPAPAAMDPSLAWLENLADTRPGRDVFAPSSEWVKARQQMTEKAKDTPAEKGPAPGSPEAFQAAHHLQATTVISGGGLAVVDNQCLAVGDTLDDFRLVRVEADAVEFQHGRDRATLTLPLGPGSNAKPTVPPRNPSQNRP